MCVIRSIAAAEWTMVRSSGQIVKASKFGIRARGKNPG